MYSKPFGGKKSGYDPKFKKTAFGDGPRPSFKAECAKCHKECRVPFKPDGRKPVLCTNCFKPREDGDRKEPGAFGAERKSRASYMARKPFDGAAKFGGPRPTASAGGSIEERLGAIEAKIDLIIRALND